MDSADPILLLQLEDSSLDAELALAQLERAGLAVRAFRVETARDFESALDTNSFDAILADFHLPDFSGLEALAIARKKAPDTPFIFCSGMMGEELAIDSLKNGATDYVLKMRLERLAPALTRALAEAREREERRRAQSALAETESRFRQMADAAPVMIWIADAAGDWTYCNSLWREFTGFDEASCLGRGWCSIVHAEDRARVASIYDVSFAARCAFTVEFRVSHKGGEISWIVGRAVPRFEAGGEFAGFIGSGTDITEIKKTEERLRHTAKLESLGVLAGGIAHDFNNLLTGIMGNASLLASEFPEGSPASGFVDSILQSSETAAQLTMQMLAYSGKGQVMVRRVNLSRVVRDIVTLIETSIPPRAELRLHTAQGLPAIEADAAQLQQLVMNLVINAGEATHASGGLVTVSTELIRVDHAAAAAMMPGYALLPGDYVMLCVNDNGCGMSAQTKSKIFDPFFTTKFTGRGLGLAAVSGIVRGHGAGLALTTRPGAGTEFRVYFPPAAAPHVDAPSGRPVAGTPTGSGTVLVVDDELIIARTAASALRRSGYSVIIASDGAGAIDLLREHGSQIDLVLLDLTMPVMPGDVAFRKLRALHPSVPVLATSGYDETDALRRFGKSLNGFIQKPYTAAQLAAKVAEVLAAAGARDVSRQ